jgi:hypothetical protein
MSSYDWLEDCTDRDVLESRSIDFPTGMVRYLAPGRYTVDRVSSSALTSPRTTMRWGAMVKDHYGGRSRRLTPGYPKRRTLPRSFARVSHPKSGNLTVAGA